MKRYRLIIAILLGVDGMLFADALAQDTATPPPPVVTEKIFVGHEPYAVELPADQPLVLWAGVTFSSPAGSFTQASVAVQTSEGEWVKMTPCDDIAIPCQTVLMRIEDVVQDEQFYLNPDGSQ